MSPEIPHLMPERLKELDNLLFVGKPGVVRADRDFHELNIAWHVDAPESTSTVGKVVCANRRKVSSPTANPAIDSADYVDCRLAKRIQPRRAQSGGPVAGSDSPVPEMVRRSNRSAGNGAGPEVFHPP